MTSLGGAVRAFNRRVLNPAMLRLAGRKYWYASVIQHVGRKSGKTYTTPVVVDHVAEGFIVPLPYGTSVDWLRNVLAAGEATIRAGGETYHVVHPKVISGVAAAALLSPRRKRTFQMFGIDNFVRIDLAPRTA